MKHFRPSDCERSVISEVSSFTIVPFVLDNSVLTACWVDTILDTEVSAFVVCVSKSSNSFTLAESCGPEVKKNKSHHKNGHKQVVMSHRFLLLIELRCDPPNLLVTC